MEVQQVADNFFDDFPARMADGRFITDYSPNCDNNMKHKKEMNGWEYRQYLTNNAETIMKEINELNDKLYGCKECHTTMLPSNKANQVCTDENCVVEEVDPNGLGIDQISQ
tara:strand:- start:1868 stop:2200 length:333 start_codon:yes stop_codon:yes gene_type:complete